MTYMPLEKPITIQESSVKPYSLFFQALANPTRFQILDLLRKNRKGLNVTEICNELQIEQTHVSHSLKCLTFCGLVNSVRDGKSRIYSLNRDTLQPLLSIVDKHLEKYASNLYECEVLER